MAKNLVVSFVIGEKAVDHIVIKTLSFVQFADLVALAQGMKQPSTFEGRLKRVRMLQQVEYSMAGKPVVLTIEEILRMPLEAARRIAGLLDDLEGKAGKVIRDNDGITSAVGYELGTPIEVGQGKDPIKELEFLAKTYGDVEDVLAAPDAMAQTVALLRTCAKPVHTSLTALPTWGVDRITIADGVILAQQVLPRFLESSAADG